MAKVPIGQILIDNGFITTKQLDKALKKKHLYPRVMIGDLLVLMGYLSADQLQYGLKVQRNIMSGVLPDTRPPVDEESVSSLSNTVSSLIQILIKKGIFTEDELMTRINKK